MAISGQINKFTDKMLPAAFAVGVREDVITVVVASCLSEDFTVCVLYIDIDPGVRLLLGMIAWLEPVFIDGEKSRMVSIRTEYNT